MSLGASLPVHPHLLLPTSLLRIVELFIFVCMATSLTCCCCSVAKSCPTLCGLQSTRLLCSWDFPGKNNWVGCHFLLQGIFQNQGLNLCLLHCRWILYHWATRKTNISHYARAVSQLPGGDRRRKEGRGAQTWWLCRSSASQKGTPFLRHSQCHSAHFSFWIHYEK